MTFKLLQINNVQFDKYLSINNNAVKSFKSEKDLLVRMKNFQHASSNKREFEIEKKKRQYLSLEEDIQEVKDQVVSVEKVIEEKSTFISKQILIFKNTEQVNKKLQNEIKVNK